MLGLLTVFGLAHVTNFRGAGASHASSSPVAPAAAFVTPRKKRSARSEQELSDFEEAEELQRDLETEIKQNKEERHIRKKKVDAIVQPGDGGIALFEEAYARRLSRRPSAKAALQNDHCSMLFSLNNPACPTRKTKASHTAKCTDTTSN